MIRDLAEITALIDRFELLYGIKLDINFKGAYSQALEGRWMGIVHKNTEDFVGQDLKIDTLYKTKNLGNL